MKIPGTYLSEDLNIYQTVSIIANSQHETGLTLPRILFAYPTEETGCL